MVLPGCYKDSFAILDWIKQELGEDTYVSVLNQYTPMYRASEYKQIARKTMTLEYQKVVEHFFAIGLKNGFMQKRNSATSEYTPMFNLSGLP